MSNPNSAPEFKAPEFEKGPNRTSPEVLAIKAELADERPVPPAVDSEDLIY